MAGKCRCDSKPCAGGCPCYKAGSECGDSCHLGKQWSSVLCLNNQYGAKVSLWLGIIIFRTNNVDVAQVKGLKPAEVRQALCDAGLSPVGDKNELLKVRVVECVVMAI